MKKKHSLPAVLAMVMLLCASTLTACAVTGTQPSTPASITVTTANTTGTTDATATTLAPDSPAAIANTAIAEITKSPDIQTPPVLKEGVLQAGSDVAFPPMEFADGLGSYTGFDVDLCLALAKKMGLAFEVVPTAWDRITSGLDDDKYDLVMSAVIITADRQQEMDFTAPYLPVRLAISAPVSAPIADASGLAGKIVGVQVDTIGETTAEGIAGVAEVRSYATILDAFAALKGGDIAAIVNEELVSGYLIGNSPDLKDVVADTGTIATQDGYGYGVKKGNTTLLTALNAALAELHSDGVYDKICAKWGVTGG